eukprot:evm.model.scf_2999.1 EVM.evm.TU.scf_2999.1   scf_2999:16158-16994(+)
MFCGLTAYIDNCESCGKFASLAATIAACSEVKNNCPVPSGDLPDPMPEDGMASENTTMADNATMAEEEDMMMPAGTLNAAAAMAALEAACEETLVAACVPASLSLAKLGTVDVDCAKILVLGPSTEIDILGCNNVEFALDVFNETATNICMAALSDG